MPQYWALKSVVEKETIEQHFKGIFNPVNFKVTVRITTQFLASGSRLTLFD